MEDEENVWSEDFPVGSSGVASVTDEEHTLKCLRTSYDEFRVERKQNPDFLRKFCPATWDSVYCWPFTPPNVTLTRSCAEIQMGDLDISPAQLALVTGNAVKICTENGTWKWGNWTNYTECVESLGDDGPSVKDVSDGVVDAVRWILFLGSIFSFITLTVSLLVFYHFKCLRCNHVTVHIHFMVSLVLRFALLLVITEPFIFHRTENYRNVLNLLFLVNIMRILLTKIQRANTSGDATQFRRAVKATAILFPLLGVNNLLFVYNPGGDYEKIYMISNTLIQASQGIFVSFLYCFFSNEVRQAVRREYQRFTARRLGKSFRRASPRPRSSYNASVVFQPKATLIRNEDQGVERDQNSSPCPETLHACQDKIAESKTRSNQVLREGTPKQLWSTIEEVTQKCQKPPDKETKNLNGNVILKFSET